MACQTLNYTLRVGVCGGEEANAGSPTASGPYLLVSNCPETVNSDAMKVAVNGRPTDTLYRAEIALSSGSHVIRAFVWHVNQLGGARNFSLWARASTGTVSISSRKEQERHDANYAIAGICLAKVHLYDQWDTVGGDPLSVGQTEVNVWQSDSTSNGQLVGAVIEFTVTSDDEFTLCLRSTVSSGSGAPGAWDQTPAFDPGNHVRGWWPFSTIVMPAGAINVNPPQSGSTVVKIQVCALEGPEFTQFEENENDEFGTERGNRGCYGANLYYNFNVTNTGNQNYPLFIYAQSRNNGGSSLGAARIEQPTAYGARGFSGMSCSGAAPAAGKWLRLTTSDGINEVPAIIAPSATPTYQIAAAIGGAGATPFNLVLSTLGIELTAEPEK